MPLHSLVFAALISAQSAQPVRNLVPLPIFPLVTAALEGDELERAKASLDTGIVLSLERLSRDLDYDVKRLADKVIDEACRELHFQAPTAKDVWTQAELRALARELDLRFTAQVALDKVSFKSVGVGTSAGSLQCTAECRFWLADVQAVKLPPREFMPVRLSRTMDTREVLDWMSQGVNPRIKLIEATVTDLVGGALEKYFAPLVRAKR